MYIFHKIRAEIKKKKKERKNKKKEIKERFLMW